MKKKDKRKIEIAALATSTDSAAAKDEGGGEDKALYRPVKQSVTIRLDSDVVAWFKNREDRYQTAINKVLRKHMLKRLGGKQPG